MHREELGYHGILAVNPAEAAALLQECQATLVEGVLAQNSTCSTCSSQRLLRQTNMPTIRQNLTRQNHFACANYVQSTDNDTDIGTNQAWIHSSSRGSLVERVQLRVGHSSTGHACRNEQGGDAGNEMNLHTLSAVSSIATPPSLLMAR